MIIFSSKYAIGIYVFYVILSLMLISLSLHVHLVQVNYLNNNYHVEQ